MFEDTWRDWLYSYPRAAFWMYVFVSSAAPVGFYAYVSQANILCLEISAMVLVYVLLAWFVGFFADAFVERQCVLLGENVPVSIVRKLTVSEKLWYVVILCNGLVLLEYFALLYFGTSNRINLIIMLTYSLGAVPIMGFKGISPKRRKAA